MNQP
jgi:hypothetical protein